MCPHYDETAPKVVGNSNREIIVDADAHGRRLDMAMEPLTPDLGRRARVRLLRENRVLVDGVPRSKGYLVHQGQVLSLRPKEMGHGACIDDVPVIHRTTDYAALLKPQGLDSASIAGADNARSVERLLDKLFPHEDARLCNRLDRPTSGILLVGFGPDAVDRFRSLEERGLVDKRYYALVWGRFASPVTVDKALDTAQRKVTRVLDETAPELRWTRARPLRQVAGADGEQTLVEACIRKGARHQIRAHLAGIGHPIVGDSLYGPEKPGYDMLHLHHAELRMPDFLAACEPEWLENI